MSATGIACPTPAGSTDIAEGAHLRRRSRIGVFARSASDEAIHRAHSRRGNTLRRHCEEHQRRSNPYLRLRALWIASLACHVRHSRYPLARNDGSSFRGARSASPESITTVLDFENHWIPIAPREFSWLWIPGLRQVGASRNDDGEANQPVWVTGRGNEPGCGSGCRAARRSTWITASVSTAIATAWCVKARSIGT